MTDPNDPLSPTALTDAEEAIGQKHPTPLTTELDPGQLANKRLDMAMFFLNKSMELNALGQIKEALEAAEEASGFFKQLSDSKYKFNEKVPIYYLAMKLENVRSFGPSQTLDMATPEGRPARWVVLLGDNGAGKTTLLQCLEGMAALATRQHDPEEHDIRLFFSPNHFCRHGEKNYRIEMSLLKGVLISENSMAGSQISSYTLKSKDGQTLSLDPGTYSSPTSSLIIAYSASRRMSSGPLSEASPVQPGLFNEDEPLLNAEERLLELDYALVKATEGKSKKRAEQVWNIAQELLIQFLPDVTTIRITKKGERIGKYQVEFETHFGWVPVFGLSLGYRTLMAWVLDLALRLCAKHPESQNPLAEPAIVMVDEIDLHLHPRWQRSIIRDLSACFPNTQFIVTAHSPLVVQTAEEANIAVLRREGDHVVIDNNPAAIRGWRIDQILTSDLFGIESSRPPSYEGMLQERDAILKKTALTDEDREELAKLEEELDQMPYGETELERHAMDVIMRAAAHLEQEGSQ